MRPPALNNAGGGFRHGEDVSRDIEISGCSQPLIFSAAASIIRFRSTSGLNLPPPQAIPEIGRSARTWSCEDLISKAQGWAPHFMSGMFAGPPSSRRTSPSALSMKSSEQCGCDRSTPGVAA